MELQRALPLFKFFFAIYFNSNSNWRIHSGSPAKLCVYIISIVVKVWTLTSQLITSTVCGILAFITMKTYSKNVFALSTDLERKCSCTFYYEQNLFCKCFCALHNIGNLYRVAIINKVLHSTNLLIFNSIPFIYLFRLMCDVWWLPSLYSRQTKDTYFYGWFPSHVVYH